MNETIEYKNTDGIVITDDPFIAEVFKNTTINNETKITNYILSISDKMTSLCEHYYYKIALDIAMFEQFEHEDKFDVDIEKKKNLLLVYALICANIKTAQILTVDEMKDDIQFLENLFDKQFFEAMEELIIEFSLLFQDLNDQIHHA